MSSSTDTPAPDRPFSLAVIDMAGTTVADDGLVLRAFEDAGTAAGLPPEGPERRAAREYVLETMGQSKIEVFRALFGDEDRAQAANAAFEASYAGRIETDVAAVPGAAEAVGELRSRGVAVALSTGFSPDTQHRILPALGWQDLADVTVAPGADGRGRPYPDLVWHAAMRCGVTDVADVAVVGDTGNDIRSGLRAGARVVAGVLTGAHDEAALRAAGATHVLASISDLPALLADPMAVRTGRRSPVATV